MVEGMSSFTSAPSEGGGGGPPDVILSHILPIGTHGGDTTRQAQRVSLNTLQRDKYSSIESFENSSFKFNNPGFCRFRIPIYNVYKCYSFIAETSDTYEGEGFCFSGQNSYTGNAIFTLHGQGFVPENVDLSLWTHGQLDRINGFGLAISKGPETYAILEWWRT
jgi:hypothetical protein